MSAQSAQQYIKDQADFYYSQGCVNQKQEIVASPSYMSVYKNKTEEQILYEHLKEKRGPSKKYHDTVMTPSSNLEKERTELLNKGQSDRSFNSVDEPSGYSREQKINQSRDIRQPVMGISYNISNNRRDREDYEERDNLRDSRPIEKIEVEASPILKQEADDSKQKKGPSLKDKLLAKKKEMETSQVEKPKAEPISESIPKENPSFSKRQEKEKVDIIEDSEEIPLRKKEIVNIREEEEIPNKMNISTMTLNSDIGDYGRANYIEEPKSLISRASDLSKQNKFEQNVVKDREQEEPRQEGKLKKIFEQEQQQPQGYERQKEEDRDYKASKQEVRRGVNLEDDEERELSESRFENRSQRGTQREEDSYGQQRNSPMRQEPQRRVEEDYMTKSGINDKQSQASKSSGQRNREEEFDESPSASYHQEQMRKSKSIENRSKEAERESQYQKRDSTNMEDSRMATSSYINQKDAQGYNEGYRARQQESFLDKPPKSETSIVESNEKKVEKSEKGGARPVVSYLKSIEEMLFKIMAKQDVLEENQRKMMQIQKRQEDEIDAIRRQLEGEE